MDDLQNLVASILKVEPSVLAPEKPRTAIAQWDSFTHLLLINELETSLGISFTMEEVASIQTLAQLHEIVQQKKC